MYKKLLPKIPFLNSTVAGNVEVSWLESRNVCARASAAVVLTADKKVVRFEQVNNDSSFMLRTVARPCYSKR